MSGRLTRRGFAAGAMSALSAGAVPAINAGTMLVSDASKARASSADAATASGANAARGLDGDADLTLILMGDLHSGYRWSSRLLEAVRSAARAAPGAVRIVVNGDVFEHNNVVARRGQGVIDLALIRAFAAIAPTLVTIGNHDSDLFDPRDFAAGVVRAGAMLLSDIVDPRTGGLYGEASHRIRVRGHDVAFVAMGTPVSSLYPAAYRAFYRVPDPVAYATARLPGLLGGADLPVVLVHAGFVADRAVLPHLRGSFLLHGAHDHLRFSQPIGRALHLQSGAWSSAFQLVTIRFTAQGPAMRASDVVLDRRSPQDPALQQLIDAETTRLLQPADRAMLGHLDRALALDDAVPCVAGWVREAAGVEMGLLSHTTFGDGLPEGSITAYDLASFLRFDGGLSVGEIPPERLDALLARTNQFDGRTPYGRRTGDYLCAATDGMAPRGRAVRVAINSYAVSTAANRIALLGWDAPGFAPLQGSGGPPTLGRIIADGLQAGSKRQQPSQADSVSTPH